MLSVASALSVAGGGIRTAVSAELDNVGPRKIAAATSAAPMAGRAYPPRTLGGDK